MSPRSKMRARVRQHRKRASKTAAAIKLGGSDVDAPSIGHRDACRQTGTLSLSMDSTLVVAGRNTHQTLAAASWSSSRHQLQRRHELHVHRHGRFGAVFRTATEVIHVIRSMTLRPHRPRRAPGQEDTIQSISGSRSAKSMATRDHDGRSRMAAWASASAGCDHLGKRRLESDLSARRRRSTQRSRPSATRRVPTYNGNDTLRTRQ